MLYKHTSSHDDTTVLREILNGSSHNLANKSLGMNHDNLMSEDEGDSLGDDDTH